MTKLVRGVLIAASALALPILLLGLTANAIQQAGLGAIVGAIILALVGLLYALESGEAAARRSKDED